MQLLAMYKETTLSQVLHSRENECVAYLLDMAIFILFIYIQLPLTIAHLPEQPALGVRAVFVSGTSYIQDRAVSCLILSWAE